MTLTDAGPLVALIDADEADHEVCRLALAGLRLPPLTTWPAFTEAMHLLSRAGGQTGRQALWSLTLSGRLDIAELSRSTVERSSWLTAKYADLPMDLGRRNPGRAGRRGGDRRVFTLDSDFGVYRFHGRQQLKIIPG